MRVLKYIFLCVDIGFILYWTITALHLVPPAYVYNDYNNPILVHWNWSFFPIDMLISISGLYSIYLYRKYNKNWRLFSLISLLLTFASGLQAIAYWAVAAEFDLTWWIPNLFLMLYPIYFIGLIGRVLLQGNPNEGYNT